MITRVNKGVCQWRLYHGGRNAKPYFVNWQEDGENKYEFFSIVSSMYTLYERLKKQENK